MENPREQELEWKGAAKLPYHPPVMVDYGQVVTLTQGDM